mmetsp:Transcript_14799/g.28388  ORF Transcript_14799/g.28388 Transcript_14799/m.28388 type:complete len:393 (-) Transcript_14799:2-1180(-)
MAERGLGVAGGRSVRASSSRAKDTFALSSSSSTSLEESFFPLLTISTSPSSFDDEDASESLDSRRSISARTRSSLFTASARSATLDSPFQITGSLASFFIPLSPSPSWSSSSRFCLLPSKIAATFSCSILDRDWNGAPSPPPPPPKAVGSAAAGAVVGAASSAETGGFAPLSSPEARRPLPSSSAAASVCSPPLPSTTCSSVLRLLRREEDEGDVLRSSASTSGAFASHTGIVVASPEPFLLIDRDEKAHPLCANMPHAAQRTVWPSDPLEASPFPPPLLPPPPEVPPKRVRRRSPHPAHRRTVPQRGRNRDESGTKEWRWTGSASRPSGSSTSGTTSCSAAGPERGPLSPSFASSSTGAAAAAKAAASSPTTTAPTENRQEGAGGGRPGLW